MAGDAAEESQQHQTAGSSDALCLFQPDDASNIKQLVVLMLCVYPNCLVMLLKKV